METQFGTPLTPSAPTPPYPYAFKISVDKSLSSFIISSYSRITREASCFIGPFIIDNNCVLRVKNNFFNLISLRHYLKIFKYSKLTSNCPKLIFKLKIKN